jgi:hypothetical protein
VLDPDGFEYDSWQGYWSPTEFAARILLGRARGLARQGREEEAEAAYEDVLRRFPTSFVAPEAAYWRAVCRYKRRPPRRLVSNAADPVPVQSVARCAILVRAPVEVVR